MDPLYYTLIGCFAAFGGLAVGWLGAWLLDRSRLQGVHARAVEIAAAAKVEADQIVKEAELKTKDELYRKARGSSIARRNRRARSCATRNVGWTSARTGWRKRIRP